MKRSKFTEEQTLFALKPADAGQPVGDVCRQMDVSEATFYVWKNRYGNLGLLEVRELRQLRDENARLKRLVADMSLNWHILQECNDPPISCSGVMFSTEIAHEYRDGRRDQALDGASEVGFGA